MVQETVVSGNKEYRGSITKAGNSHVRRLLVEAAWNNHHRVGANLILNRRRQGQRPEIVAIALKAQHRLAKRFFHLDQDTVLDVRYYPLQKRFLIKIKPDSVFIVGHDTLTNSAEHPGAILQTAVRSKVSLLLVSLLAAVAAFLLNL